YFAVTCWVNKYDIVASVIITTVNQNCVHTGGKDWKTTPFSAS
ncbi:GSCOCG00000046001-RA-CDS, partial [Cotesia congregata]